MELVDRLRLALPPEVFSLMWDTLAEGRSLAEAGRERGVSRQRTQQVVTRGIAKARRTHKRWMESVLPE
jgi:hypothetical protein